MSNNKEKQRKRMLAYFIEATSKIIESDGIENVTIRKVADLAGYNSATLYNYFEDLDHLIFFASMKYLEEYNIELSKSINKLDSSIDIFLKTWECFSKFSFANPKIFYNIFFSKHKDKLKETITEYYEIFPEELGENEGVILSMLKYKYIFDRNRIIMCPLIHDGIIMREKFDIINRTMIYSYQSLLYESTINSEKTIEQLTEEIMEIVRFLIMCRHHS